MTTPTGPFIVTVRRPHSADCGLVPPMGTCTCAARILYREAFATLGDIERRFADTDFGQFGLDLVIANVEIRGRGEVGLADGSVIEVKTTTWADFAHAVWDRLPAYHSGGWEQSSASQHVLLAAWNAEYGIGIEERA